MAAPMALRRELTSLARIFSGISHVAPRALGACSAHRKCNIIRSHFPLTSSNPFHTATVFSSATSTITVTEEPDTLFQKVSLLVKGHDRTVLDSYEFFATMAAKELGITISKVYEPRKEMERFTLLKSVHIFKKHRVQYEMRTHFRCIEVYADAQKSHSNTNKLTYRGSGRPATLLFCELSHLTGSTAQVYLEYIERNLPEGVAMEVTKTAMEKIPDHILEPMWKDHPIDDKSSQ